MNRTLMEGENSPIGFQAVLISPDRKRLTFQSTLDGRATMYPFRDAEPELDD